MSYRLMVLTKEILRELQNQGLAWKEYDLQYKSVCVFPPNGEKPLIVTNEVWKNYFKPLWDKGIFTFSYKKAVYSCENVDYKWKAEYRSKKHLNKVYDKKTSAFQKHKKWNDSVKFERHIWTRNERAAFRHTYKWIEFRNQMVKSHNCVCEECEKKFTDEQMEVHHLIEDVDYENLDPKRFLVLCKACHDRIHKYDTIREVRPIKAIKKIKKIKKIKQIKVKKIFKRVKKVVAAGD